MALFQCIRGAHCGPWLKNGVCRRRYRRFAGTAPALTNTQPLRSQRLNSTSTVVLDKETLRNEINPRTRHLFDILENRLAKNSMNAQKKERMRQLAFTAWTSALGLLTMLGVADATSDPLIHKDSDLLDILADVFDSAVRNQE